MTSTTFRYLLLLVVLIQAFMTEGIQAQETRALSSIDTQDCFEKGSYDCTLCSCDLTDSHFTLNIVLASLLLVPSVFVLFSYIAIKDTREKPGDILLTLAIADIILAAGKINANVIYVETDFSLGVDPETSRCFTSSVVLAVAVNLRHFYHISYFVYYLLMARTSLKGTMWPSFTYHLFPVVATVAAILATKSVGQLGMSVYGSCELKTTPGVLNPLLLNVLLFLILCYFAYYTRKYIPECQKVSVLKTQFMRYYMQYLLAISIIYIIKAVVEITTGSIIQRVFEDDPEIETLIARLSTIKNVMDITNGVAPIILSFGRLNDPTIKQHWQKIISKCLFKKPEENSQLTDSLQEGSTASTGIEMSVNRQSLVQQFQQSRRVQVLYSLLSGIHYFWHVKKMNKLIELKPLKAPTSEDDSDNEDYIKEAKNRRTLFVDEKNLTAQVPELFEEIKEKHYSLAKGTLTAFAPRLFEEIIELDDTGRGIHASLDLKQNFNRILKSGINGGGKSGEFFFFSDDNKFIIKTISDAELEVFKAILAQFAKFLKFNPNSIIAKIYGLFTFEIAEPYERYNLILMKNINGYPSDFVDRKYDLKGSTIGRIAIKDPNVTLADLKQLGVLKDLDFDRFERKMHIDKLTKIDLVKRLRKDIQFLSSMGLVDYSLAVYVIDRTKHGRTTASQSISYGSKGKSSEKDVARSLSVHQSKTQKDSSTSFKSTQEDKYYHIGVIDYLIQFNLRKKSEVFFKKLSAFNPNLDISVQKPDYYGERFIKYMEKIILD